MNYSVIGVDISKRKLDVCVRKSGVTMKEAIIPNDETSIKKWFESQIRAGLITEDAVICAEHTGIYTSPLVKAAGVVGIKVCVEDAVCIRKSAGVSRGKNDRIDALRIAEYAERYGDRLHAYAESSCDVSSIRRLMKMRTSLVRDRGKYSAQINDEEGYVSEEERAMRIRLYQPVIDMLSRQISEIESEIRRLVSCNATINRQMRLLMSVDGVGEQVALKMIVETNAFTWFDTPRKFCCHAGVAPFSYTSGSSRHSRSRVSNRADKSIKELLHMAALASCRHIDGPLRAYYDRKVAEGKNKMLVLNAVRAKLVIIMFAVIRNNTLFSKDYIPMLS